MGKLSINTITTEQPEMTLNESSKIGKMCLVNQCSEKLLIN